MGSIFRGRCYTGRMMQYLLSVAQSVAPVYSGQPMQALYRALWHYTVTFGLCQLYILHHRFPIYLRGATADCPDPGAIFIGCEAVSLFRELLVRMRQQAPAPEQRR